MSYNCFITMDNVNKLRLQIVVLGACNTGKTYFLQRFTYGHQDPKTKSTMGVELLSARIRQNTKQHSLLIWDSSGNPVFDSILTQFHIKEKMFFVIFYDVTADSSIEQIYKYLQMIDQNCKDRSKVRILMLGNKTDLIQSQGVDCSSKVKEEFQDRPDTIIYSTSAKADFAGARKIFQNFIMKCFEQKYLQAIIADISTFFEGLNCKANVQWFKFVQERQKIQNRLLQLMEKSSDTQQVMTIGLAIQLYRKLKEKESIQILQTKIICHQEYKKIEQKYKETIRTIQQLQQNQTQLRYKLDLRQRQIGELNQVISMEKKYNRTLSNQQLQSLKQHQFNKQVLSSLQQRLEQTTSMLAKANAKVVQYQQLQSRLFLSNQMLEAAKSKIKQCQQIERRLIQTSDALALAEKKIDQYQQNQLRIKDQILQKTEALAKAQRDAAEHLTLLMQTKTKYIQQCIKKQPSQNGQTIKEMLASMKQDYQKGLGELREQLITYQYWIIEADRLLDSITDSIDQSPYRHRFQEFRCVAHRINDNLEEVMRLWDYNSNQQQLASFFIEEDMKTGQQRQGERNSNRKLFEAKLHQYQEILQEFIPIFHTQLAQSTKDLPPSLNL